MIELIDATVGSGDFTLRGLNFRVEAGEYAVMMGRTGIGKTTILETICGLRSLQEGRILIQEQDVSRWGSADRNVGYVPQDLALFPTMTVKGHLEFAVRLRGATGKRMREVVSNISEMLHIAHLLERRVVGLSGGEAQRVALGRALSFGPSVLLLDEPLSALDVDTRQATEARLREINAQTGVTVLHVTHNESEAAALANRTIIIETEHEPAKRAQVKLAVRDSMQRPLTKQNE